MKVKADLSDATVQLGNKGVSLAISDETGKHLGTLRIGQATVEWRKGRTRAGNGTKLKLEKLIAMLDALE